jgi:hypothetical protein
MRSGDQTVSIGSEEARCLDSEGKRKLKANDNRKGFAGVLPPQCDTMEPALLLPTHAEEWH